MCVCGWVFSLSLSLCLIHTISIIDESIEEASSKGSDGTRRPFSLKFEPQVTLAECSTRLIWSSRAFILWPGSRLLGQSEPSRAAAGIYTNFSGMNWLQRCKIGRNGRAWLQSWSRGAQDNKETMEGNCGRKENVKLKFEGSKVSQHSLPCVGEFSVPMSVHLPSFSLSSIYPFLPSGLVAHAHLFQSYLFHGVKLLGLPHIHSNPSCPPPFFLFFTPTPFLLTLSHAVVSKRPHWKYGSFTILKSRFKTKKCYDICV